MLSPDGVRALTSQATSADLWGVHGGYGFGWYQRTTGGQQLVVDPGITRGTHATGCRWAEGPVYVPAGKYVVWSDIPNDRLLRWDETNSVVSTFRAPAGYVNGNCLARQGRRTTAPRADHLVLATRSRATARAPVSARPAAARSSSMCCRSLPAAVAATACASRAACVTAPRRPVVSRKIAAPYRSPLATLRGRP